MVKKQNRRTQPDDDSPLCSVEQAAEIAGVSESLYRNAILPSSGHPSAITDTRPMLFRRAEVMEFLLGSKAKTA